MSVSAAYPINPPSAVVIRDDAEAIRVAHEVAALLLAGASERDRTRQVPVEVVDAFSNSGLWGITVPREYGGAQVSYATLAQVIAIVSAADPSLGQIPQNHYCLLEDIRLQGSHDQKQFFFDLALAGHRFANALSETGGKNVQDIRTRLVADGEGYRIDGRKGYCTGSLYAHWLGVLALDSEDRAQLAFVPRESAGLTVVDDWDSIGQRTTSSGTVLVEGLWVPAFNLFPTYRSYERPTLAGPFAQITTAAIDAGIARAALRDTIAFVREQARPWIDAGVEKASEDPLTIIQVGGLDIRLEAADALLERAGRVLDQARAAPDEASVAQASLAVARAKVLTTEIAIEASNKLFELGGTRSTLRKHNLDRHWRNARVHTLHDPVRWKYHVVGNWLLNGINPPRHDWS
ncbi:SfnB family sulfur acquisition oxidoreductase [Pseudomonas vancouverensis]|uniref:Dibenzothiophene monooxygenase n=1 Tax=Pseudomonas vancouverensis TaxID=95300 RepID=A0A1H2P9Q0_PSEVA|nr:SfnB family sulfur acquisition oxidoreductase [Pseudomonas vancouverensis]KAB0490167.1 SfnB family sulfur acquisition oxidoreductase [Pseudomonas vancouverensis]TDB58729.1 SfnB family sulfur acquisition oxidoreductase [Pseudomonas vancouverensis]SDV14429.1 sulfur acquisition oxidoreductase, SfnB family [Pseudomonas vancouverensis]